MCQITSGRKTEAVGILSFGGGMLIGPLPTSGLVQL
jgi:hypothetical protein